MNVVSHEAEPKETWRDGVETRMHVSARNGSSQLCVFEQWVAPGSGAPTHSHDVEEVLTVVAGTAEMWIEQQTAVLASGQSLIIPAHCNHGFRNVGDGTLHVRAILASRIFEAVFEGKTGTVTRWGRG